jgi:hypothetical protein
MVGAERRMRHGSSLQKPAAGVKRHRAAVAVCSLAAKLTAINVAFSRGNPGLRQFRDEKNSHEAACSFVVIGCSVNKIGYGA